MERSKRWSTLAAARRDGWRPAHDRHNWPDDEEFIPEFVLGKRQTTDRLFTTVEMIAGMSYGPSGQTLDGWYANGCKSTSRRYIPSQPVSRHLDLSRYPTMGARIRALRQHRNHISQTQLAHTIGVDHTHISRIEVGQRDPTIKTLKAIAQALRISPSDLIDGGLVA